MFCPTCRSEFRAGLQRCPNCTVDLVAELPPDLSRLSEVEIEEMVGSGRLLPVARGTLADARSIVAALLESGIPALIFRQAGSAPGRHQQVAFDVVVGSTDIERALAFTRGEWERMVAQEGGSVMEEALDCEAGAIVCPACGTGFCVSASLPECPGCGLYLWVPEEQSGGCGGGCCG